MTHPHLIVSRVGYYLDASQPADQPTRDAANGCVICGEPHDENTVRTHAVMWEGERAISLFYRTHRACHDGLTPDDAAALAEAVLAIGDKIARVTGRISGPDQGSA